VVVMAWTSALNGAGTVFIVVPNGLRFEDGNSSSFIPFLIQQTGLPSMRYQQVYDASAFSAITPPGAYLTRLFMRADAEPGLPQGASGTSTNVQISFSTTSKAVDGLSSIFAENVGLDETVAFGPAALTMSFYEIAFDDDFPLTNAFWYNPAAGNLLLDVRIYGGEPFMPFEEGLDAQSTLGDSVSCVYSGSVTEPSAQFTNTLGLVTGFQFDPIPVLTNSLTTNAVVITWPVQPTIFVLQWVDRLNTNVNWQGYTNETGGNGLYHVLTLPRDSLDQARFFRLLCPSCPPIAPSIPSITTTPIKQPPLVQ
jgi:hypothetical protein